jgi:hypothetical protein
MDLLCKVMKKSESSKKINKFLIAFDAFENTPQNEVV